MLSLWNIAGVKMRMKCTLRYVTPTLLDVMMAIWINDKWVFTFRICFLQA